MATVSGPVAANTSTISIQVTRAGPGLTPAHFQPPIPYKAKPPKRATAGGACSSEEKAGYTHSGHSPFKLPKCPTRTAPQAKAGAACFTKPTDANAVSSSCTDFFPPLKGSPNDQASSLSPPWLDSSQQQKTLPTEVSASDKRRAESSASELPGLLHSAAENVRNHLGDTFRPSHRCCQDQE